METHILIVRMEVRDYAQEQHMSGTQRKEGFARIEGSFQGNWVELLIPN